MQETTVQIPQADLKAAFKGSWYFIAGAGGDLSEWVAGYEEWLAEEKIGKPVQWYQTTGDAINRFAGPDVVVYDNFFQQDLTCLLFPLDGLNVPKLAIFKIQHEDRWFDDVIQNMRRDG